MDIIIKKLDAFSGIVGTATSWLTTSLMLLICADVFIRYFLKASFVWMIELEVHMFSLIFLLGAAYTLREDAHVRVDLFYTNFSESRKALVNLAGIIVFLIPWCLIVMRTSMRYAQNSFKIRETSSDPGGLPALYIMKFMIVVAFFLLLVEALNLLLKCLLVLLGKRDQVFLKMNTD